MIEGNSISESMRTIDGLFERHKHMLEDPTLAKLGLSADEVRERLGTPETKYHATRKRQPNKTNYSIHLLVRGAIRQKRGRAVAAAEIAEELELSSFQVGNVLSVLSTKHPQIQRERSRDVTLWAWRETELSLDRDAPTIEAHE